MIILSIITSCSWVADNSLIGEWGAKYKGTYKIDDSTVYNYTSGDLIIFIFTSDGNLAVNWFINNNQNGYYKCYAFNGKLEYWIEDKYETKKETTYSLNGDVLEIIWNGKKVILGRL